MSEQKKRDGRGGARSGAGRPRSRLHLDKEAATLLAEHMEMLHEPGLSEEEAVKRLLLHTKTRREAAYTEVISLVQEVVQQHWSAIVEQVNSRLETLPTQIIDQVQEALRERGT